MKRIIRKRKLTKKQAAEYDKVRSQIVKDYPTLKRRKG
jgi:hypothetical protein